MEKEVGELFEFLEKEKVSFVRLGFVDILGELCDMSVPLSKFLKEVEKGGGFGFDGSSVHGMARIDESDRILKPDLETLIVFPWYYETKLLDKKWKEAMAFCDILKPDGHPYEADSRYLLKKILEKNKEIADKFYVGPEFEFFLFKADENGMPSVRKGMPVGVDRGNYFKGGRYGEVRKEVQLVLGELAHFSQKILKNGIKIRTNYVTEADHHEVASSQHEIDIEYDEALPMADKILLVKYITKKVAKKYGLFASFMPKPIANMNGSGMHLHLSLFKNGKNLFYDKDKPGGLSQTAIYFIGGLFKHIREITLVLNQYINSYKRLLPNFEAPCYVTWAFLNRSDLIRIPYGKEKSMRIELRSPDPCFNPYLAFALILEAGIDGIKNKITPPPPTEENVYGLSKTERKRRKIEALPINLEEAIALAEKSEFLKKVLGEHLFCKLIEDKKKRVKEYRKSLGIFSKIKEKFYKTKITEYELEKLLPVL